MGGCPPVLEGYESILTVVGAAQIEVLQSTILGILDRLPIQQVHAAGRAEAGVRGAVLVDHRVLVANRDHGGEREVLLVGNANFECRAKARH